MADVVDVTGDATGPLTGAQRQARYRRRQKERKARGPVGSGVGADGEWRPEFPGQRPPFLEGNSLSVTHGAYSPAVAGPLAERILAGLLASADTPEYLRDPGWRYTLESWAEARAELVLLRQWRDRLTIEEAASAISISEETGDRPAPGRARKRGHMQQMESVLAAIDRAERRAERLSARLGLDPVSRARLGKDVAGPAFGLARRWAQMDAEQGKERPAIGA